MIMINYQILTFTALQLIGCRVRYADPLRWVHIECDNFVFVGIFNWILRDIQIGATLTDCTLLFPWTDILPQYRADQNCITWIGITIPQIPHYNHTTPPHVSLHYRAIPYILPQSRAEQSRAELYNLEWYFYPTSTSPRHDNTTTTCVIIIYSYSRHIATTQSRVV